MQYILTYILFFFGIFLEGEFVLLSAVIAAHQGYLNIWMVIFIAIVGTITSDLFYFNLGKHKTHKILSNSKFSSKYEAVSKKLVKHRTKMLISYRFIYGMRMITPFVLGTQKLSTLIFLKYSIISTFIWCFVFVGLGYPFGELIINNLKYIQKIEFYFIGILLLIALVSLVYSLIKNKSGLQEK